jgi:hypothetical protein
MWYEHAQKNNAPGGSSMNSRIICFLSFGFLSFGLAIPQHLQAKSFIAYISDSTNSSVIYWIAKRQAYLKSTGSTSTQSLSTAASAVSKV